MLNLECMWPVGMKRQNKLNHQRCLGVVRHRVNRNVCMVP
eukprot:UN11533